MVGLVVAFHAASCGYFFCVRFPGVLEFPGSIYEDITDIYHLPGGPRSALGCFFGSLAASQSMLDVGTLIVQSAPVAEAWSSALTTACCLRQGLSAAGSAGLSSTLWLTSTRHLAHALEPGSHIPHSAHLAQCMWPSC